MKLSNWMFAMVAAGLALCASNVRAQVTNAIPGGFEVITNAVPGGLTSTNLNQANFVENFATWVTTRYQSGLTWPANDTDFEVGADYASQTLWANYIAVTKNFSSFYVGAQMDNAGVAGVVNQLGGRAGYTISNAGDLRVKAGLYAGYQLHNANAPKGAIIQPEFGAEKLITAPTVMNPTASTTFISAWIYWPFQFRGSPSGVPGFKLGGGFTF